MREGGHHSQSGHAGNFVLISATPTGNHLDNCRRQPADKAARQSASTAIGSSTRVWNAGLDNIE